MGIYLLNISADLADPTLNHLPEDLSFNDQESIVELIIEQVLGYEDAIAEYDDHDTEDHNQKKNVKIDLFFPPIIACQAPRSYSAVKQKPRCADAACLVSGFKETDSPPPKV